MFLEIDTISAHRRALNTCNRYIVVIMILAGRALLSGHMPGRIFGCSATATVVPMLNVHGHCFTLFERADESRILNDATGN